MLHPDLAVGPSRINGLGVLAERRIPAGTVLWVFRIDTTRRYESARDSFAHAFEDPHGALWMCVDGARYWNHSCEPNASCHGDLDLALRDIEAGEELTYDYGLIYPTAAPPFPCACGASTCRSVVRREPAGSPVCVRLRTAASAAAKRMPFVPQRLVPSAASSGSP